MNSARVVIPLLSFSPSGGVRSVVAIANGLARNGVSTKIYVPSYAAVPPEESVGGSVDVVTIPAQGRARRFRYVNKLIGFLSRENALFVSTGYKTPLYIYASQMLSGRRPRVVSLIQSYEPLTHVRYGGQPAVLKPFLHAVAQIGYWLPGYKIAVSDFVAARVGPGRINRVINPGIGPEFTALLAPDNIPASGTSAKAPDNGRKKPVVGFFPSVGRVKGIRYAVEAFDLLSGRAAGGAGFDFLIYDVDYPAQNLPEYVRRFSTVAEAASPAPIIEFYRACDVFLYPSLVEGFGLPPLEAMACGTPVIVTNCGGVMTYAKNRENCIVIPPGSGRAIAGAIRELTSDPELAGRLSAGGLETARAYDRERFVASCVEEITSLLELTAAPAKKG